STVSDNSAFSGGGIAATVVNLTNSTVSGNTSSSFGGGISAGTANLTNSTVSGNTSGSAGGGIILVHGTLLNCTIVENIATGNGGGVFQSGTSDPIRVKNTIIANNLTLAIPENGQDVFGVFVSQGHNLIGVVNGSSGFGAAGDLVGTFD